MHPRSQTETYAALRLEIENWRWAGVPFYIRAGKRLAKRVTEITIMFKQPPLSPLQGRGGQRRRGHPATTSSPCASSRMRASRCASAPSCPGRIMTISPVNMNFSLRRGLRRLVCQRLRAPAARRHARRRHALRPSRRRRSHLGADDADPRILGRKPASRICPTTPPEPGARRPPMPCSKPTAANGESCKGRDLGIGNRVRGSATRLHDLR